MLSAPRYGSMYQKQKHNMRRIHAINHQCVHICTTEAALLELALISSDLSF